ncbi:MAG: hypothetical protein HY958_13450 [Bacteroidia bacterium]|nr:hypothetical protein [Bacteroidia bacterium]
MCPHGSCRQAGRSVLFNFKNLHAFALNLAAALNKYNGTGATTVTGMYPNFTISSTDNDNQTLSII